MSKYKKIKYFVTRILVQFNAVMLLFFPQLLQKLKLDDIYEGQKEVDGEQFNVEDVDDKPGAFRCYLDVGLVRTTTGTYLSSYKIKL